MYKYESRVRFSETDREGNLTLEAIVDYFQDCSTFQSEDIGLGFSYLQPRNLAWVLSYWQIVVKQYPTMGDYISIGTLPYDFKGFMGKRNFFMENEQGEKIVCADSLWTLLNVEKMVPQRVSEELQREYPLEEKIDMDYAPRKITITGEEQVESPLIIQKHHLDRLGHVNNGQYIRLAGTYLPDDFRIRQMRAEYKNQAHLQDVICPYVYKEEGKITVSLCNTEKVPYAVIEFQNQQIM